MKYYILIFDEHFILHLHDVDNHMLQVTADIYLRLVRIIRLGVFTKLNAYNIINTHIIILMKSVFVEYVPILCRSKNSNRIYYTSEIYEKYEKIYEVKYFRHNTKIYVGVQRKFDKFQVQC